MGSSFESQQINRKQNHVYVEHNVFQLWYAHRPPDEDHCRSRAYSQSDVQDSSSPETMKLNVGISSNGDVEVGEISLTEMDPEDIRVRVRGKKSYQFNLFLSYLFMLFEINLTALILFLSPVFLCF